MIILMGSMAADRQAWGWSQLKRDILIHKQEAERIHWERHGLLKPPEINFQTVSNSSIHWRLSIDIQEHMKTMNIQTITHD